MSQHDLDVANQGFSAFRTDMNAALVALGTLQSGATAPATTFAYMLWADTTANLLKRRNAANSGWIVLCTLSETFVVSRSSNTILAGSDVGKMFQATAAFTQTLTAAATLGDGWFCSYNAGGFSIVLDPNSSELIDGATTKTVTGSGLIYCNGSAFFTVGFVPVATQSEMEAASSSAVFATPLNMNWHPGVAKFWLKANVSGAMQVNWNMTSVTDDGGGLISGTIATDFSSANWCGLVSTYDATNGDTALRTAKFKALAAGTFSAACINISSVNADPDNWFFAGFGDQ